MTPQSLDEGEPGNPSPNKPVEVTLSLGVGRFALTLGHEEEQRGPRCLSGGAENAVYNN